MQNIEGEFKKTQEDLFFIVGCPRSGTSLTQYMLSMNSQISMPPESWYFNIVNNFFGHNADLSDPKVFEQVLTRFTMDKRWARFDFDINRFEELARLAPPTIPGLFTAFGTAWREFHGTHRFGEKSPENYQYMSVLAEWFPEAKFIYLMRDPRATVASHSKRRGAMKNIYRALRLWIRGEYFLRKGLEELGVSRVHMLRYEDLVTEPEREVRKLCSFLNLDFEAAMLNPHERDKQGFLPEQLPFMQNTEKPIFKDSINAWEKETSKRQVALIEYAVGEERLKKYGYEPKSSRVSWVGAHALFSRLRYELSEGVRYPVRQFRKKYLEVWKIDS